MAFTYDVVGDYQIPVEGTEWGSEVTDLLKVVAWFPVEGEPQSLKTTKLTTSGNVGIGSGPTNKVYGASPTLSGPMARITDGTNEATLAIISGTGSGSGLNGASIELLDRDAAGDTKWLNIRSQDGYGKIKSMKSDGTINKDNIFNIDLDTGVIISGNITYDSLDPAFVINKSVVGAGNAHCFVDESSINKTGTIGYNSFDSRYEVVGTENYDHLIGFQAAPTYTSTGTLLEFGGLASILTVSSGAGTVTELKNIWIEDYLGTGTVTNNFGVHVTALTKGDNNWAIYTDGITKSYFGGYIYIGSTTPTATGAIVSVKQSRGSAGTAHCFLDESSLDMSGTINYNSYDARAEAIGSSNYNSHVGFQASPIFSSSGTLGTLGGFVSAANSNGGTITNLKNFWVQDFINSGTVTNNYGLYIDSLTKGTTNWAIYTAGTTQSHFGGPVGFGVQEPLYQVHQQKNQAGTTWSVIENSATPGSTVKMGYAFYHSSAIQAWIVKSSDGVSAPLEISVASANPIIFKNNSTQEIARFDGSRNFGLGATSIEAKLDVYNPSVIGDFAAARFYTNNDGTTIKDIPGFVIYNNLSGGLIDTTLVYGNTVNSYLAIGKHNGTSYSETCIFNSSGCFGLGTNTFGDNAEKSFAMAIGVAPAVPIANQIEIFAKNSSLGTTNATLGMMLEQGTEAIGTFTPTHKLRIWINSTEYFVQLEVV